MTVREILKDKSDRVVSMKVEDQVIDAARVLTRERIGAVLVLDGAGRIAGIVSERDIVRSLAAQGEGALSLRLGEMMTSDVVFCQPADSIDDVMSLMTERRFRHLPVLESGCLAGIISIGDVVKQRIAETEFEAQALREYITTG